jgi:hypothetical protein
MKRQVKPGIEPLEAKSLLSGTTLIGLHAGATAPAVFGTTSTGLTVKLTTNQSTYKPGQLVRMTFTETNNTSHAVFVGIGPSIDGFYITHGAQVVWRSNSGALPQYIIRERLLPGQSITLTATWTASSAGGTYVAHNQLAPNVGASFQIVAS